jgi:ankyrin repeat protein
VLLQVDEPQIIGWQFDSTGVLIDVPPNTTYDQAPVLMAPTTEDLLYAIKHNDLDAVRLCLHHCPELINGCIATDFCPLCYAVDMAGADMVSMLLELGADPTCLNQNSPFHENNIESLMDRSTITTPLQRAVAAGKEDMVKCILYHAAPPAGSMGGLLLYANTESMVQLLLKPAGGEYMDQPLCWAVASGNTAALCHLLGIMSFGQDAALQLASELGHVEDLKVLLAWPGYDLSCLKTPLMLAISYNRVEAAAVLVEAGADSCLLSPSVLCLAAESSAMMELLLKA